MALKKLKSIAKISWPVGFSLMVINGITQAEIKLRGIEFPLSLLILSASLFLFWAFFRAVEIWLVHLVTAGSPLDAADESQR